MHIRNKRGQSTVEYVLLMTAVVAVIIALVTGTQQGGMQYQLNSTLNGATAAMTDMQGRLSTAEQGTNATSNATSVITVNVS